MAHWDEVDPNSVPGGGGVDGGGIAGAILNVGAGLYDSYQARKVARENTNKTIQAQRDEAELAYQRSVEMWHKQNMYNSPEAQMQRFKEAGLNPHLIYGQGSPGNTAVSTPEYNAPNLHYNYQSAPISPALSSVLPTLMSVGTWMQNMRMSEVGIRKATSETMRVDQLIDYLAELNPKVLQERSNKLDLFQSQKQMQSYNENIAREKLFELEQEFRYKYGEDLFTDYGSSWDSKRPGGKFGTFGGKKRLEFLQEVSKQKLLEAKASWADMDITDPQAIMMMVLNGVMGLAGASIRNTRPGSVRPSTSQKARPTGVRRIHPSRRVQMQKYRD